MNRWLNLAVVVAAIASFPSLCEAQPATVGPLTVSSPDRAIVVTIDTRGPLTWSVSLRGRAITRPSRIAMTLGGNRVLGAPAGRDAARRRGRTTPCCARSSAIKRAEVRDRFNERRIDFAGDYSLIVRAYDDGVAYRFVTTLPGEITVVERGRDAGVRRPTTSCSSRRRPASCRTRSDRTSG